MCLNLKKALVQSFEKHRFLHNSALQGHFGEIPPILTFRALESRILYMAGFSERGRSGKGVINLNRKL